MNDRFLPEGQSNRGTFSIKVSYFAAPDGWVEELYRELQKTIRDRQDEARHVMVSVEIDGHFGGGGER